MFVGSGIIVGGIGGGGFLGGVVPQSIVCEEEFVLAGLQGVGPLEPGCGVGGAVEFYAGGD